MEHLCFSEKVFTWSTFDGILCFYAEQSITHHVSFEGFKESLKVVEAQCIAGEAREMDSVATS